jgi:hypothetical protein
MQIDFSALDFNQAFNRGATMRALGLPQDAVILEQEDKACWLEGWSFEDSRKECAVGIIWRLDLSRRAALCAD